MHSSSLPSRRYYRRMSPRGLGPGFGIGGICKVAVVGTCTYLICKKALHTARDTDAMSPQLPGTRYPYSPQNGPRSAV